MVCCEEAFEDGLGLCESVGMTSSCHFPHRKGEAEAATGGSSKQGKVGFVVSFHGKMIAKKTRVEEGKLREKWKRSRWNVNAYVLTAVLAPLKIFARTVVGRNLLRHAGESVSDCEMADCVLVRVFD